ncbi:MAG TPA: NIP7 N-terminal domain-related protein [Nitrososphaera sp.]|jgi:predicted RNA-binding protein (TIGR00451 family)
MKHREPTRQERTLINRALDRWGVFDFFRDKTILLGEENQSTKVCLLSANLKPVVENLEPYLAGLAIGELKKQFTPTMPGADLFARVTSNGRFYITVGENAEKLVLYGRDIMGESIVSASDDLDENELVIILNGKRDAIGVGRTRFAGKSLFQRERITVTTVIDAGLYLREEGD